MKHLLILTLFLIGCQKYNDCPAGLDGKWIITEIYQDNALIKQANDSVYEYFIFDADKHSRYISNLGVDSLIYTAPINCSYIHPKGELIYYGYGIGYPYNFRILKRQ